VDKTRKTMGFRKSSLKITRLQVILRIYTVFKVRAPGWTRRNQTESLNRKVRVLCFKSHLAAGFVSYSRGGFFVNYEKAKTEKTFGSNAESLRPFNPSLTIPDASTAPENFSPGSP
jgi:hypothetical protein